MRSSEILKRIIFSRRQSNPRLSLRAIAKKMCIPSGRLSEILNGKRRLTDYYLEKACAALKLSPQEVAQIRKSHYHSTETSQDRVNYGALLRDQQIEKLSDWKPYAIMSFLQTVRYRSFAKKYPTLAQQMSWMAEYLGIRESELVDVMKALTDANLICWEGDGWRPTYEKASTGYDVPNKYIQNAHARDLELAQLKLFSVAVPKRDYSSMTIAIHPKDITKAKKMIRDFRRELATILEKGEKQDVYQLSIQFFPVFEVNE